MWVFIIQRVSFSLAQLLGGLVPPFASVTLSPEQCSCQVLDPVPLTWSVPMTLHSTNARGGPTFHGPIQCWPLFCCLRSRHVELLKVAEIQSHLFFFTGSLHARIYFNAFGCGSCSSWLVPAALPQGCPHPSPNCCSTVHVKNFSMPFVL